VGGGAEGDAHRLVAAAEHVRPGAHAAGDDHGLAHVAVDFGYVLVAGRERAGRALAVDVQLPIRTVDRRVADRGQSVGVDADLVGLLLGDVVCHVVQQFHLEVLDRVGVEHLAERFAGLVGDQLAVHPCEVDARAHRTVVLVCQLGAGGRGRELFVGSSSASRSPCFFSICRR